jgi:hypothetical protein
MQANTLSPELQAYMPRFVQIESGGDPNAQTGSYSGLLQMSPSETAKYGGNGLEHGTQMYADRAAELKKNFGRDPSPTELYLANQQGMGGIQAHMSNPDAPAWQNMASTAEGRQKGQGWAKQAVWGNVPNDAKSQYPGGVDSLTSQQFMDLWHSKVERGQSQQTSYPPQPRGALSMAAPQYAQPDQGSLSSRVMAGGPGALFGVPNGIFPGAQGQPGQGYNLGNALQNAGASLQSINDPQGGAALKNNAAAQLAMRQPKWGEISKDMFGQPQYGWINAANQTVTPASASNGMSGGTDSTGGMGEMLTNLQAAKDSGKSNDELLSMVHPALRTDMEAMANGTAFPAKLGRAGPVREALVLGARILNPAFDERKLPGQVKYNTDLQSTALNTPGGQKIALGTAVEHLGMLADGTVAMGNSDGGSVSDMPGGATAAHIYNASKNSTTQGAANAAALGSAAQKYGGEGMKLYAGTSGGGVAERAAMEGRYGHNLTNAEYASALETDLGLMTGRHSQLQQQADENGNKVKFISPDTQKTIDHIKARIVQLRGGRPSVGDASPTAPALPKGVTSISVVGGQ